MLSRYGETVGRFSADEIEDKIDDFEELAASRVNNAPTGRFLLAVGVFGALVIPCGLPAAGAIALPILINAIKSATKNGKQAEYIARTGNFCHLLNDREIAQLIRFTGRKFIVDQCVAAHIDGMKLTGAAIELVEMIEGRLTPSTFAEVKKAYTTNSQNQAEQFAETAIANDSQQSTNVSTITVQTSDSMPQDSAITELPNSLPSFNPVDYLVGNRLRTSLIISVSGGGKDILLSNALRSFLPTYPKFTVIVMDCKNDPKETGYYAELDRVTFYRLNLAASSDSTIAAWIDAILDDFNNRPEYCLLICNEGTLIREKSKRYADVVKSLVSSGDSRQKYCWEAGQSAHNDDLKTNGASRSRFRPLMIGMLGEEMQIEAVLQAKWFADSARDLSAITSEMRRSPVRRAWCDGMRWYPMPELPNHSRYDRDSRSFFAVQNTQSNSQLETEKKPIETTKANIKKPELPRKDLMLIAAELAEWVERTNIVDASEIYEKWQSRKHGFSRPEIRYLLTLVVSIE
ncbi:MAG: hypothetical protein MUC48_22465 [Leptolyngbya sp. Prado105]|jgi:hypothetical protein|nr:hypothetical protein [Leptolyngbya sp. Prado105]